MILGDIIKLQRGFDITKAEQEEGDYPVISSSGIKSFHSEYKVEGPGVVIGRKGTLGTVFYSDGPYWPHDTSLWVKDFKGNHPKYIYYFLKTLPLEKLDSGSANPTLNRNYAHLIKVNVPPVEEQKRIASILSALDSKIELNNRINAELEALAKTIYDYWFVQFDFPISAAQAAEMGNPELEGKPYKSSGGEMVWNEKLKREVPKGWEVKPLKHWIRKDKSGDWGKESEEGNYVTKVSCVRGTDLNGINGTGTPNCPTRFILEKNEHKILEPYELIIEISGGSPTQSTGRMAFITEETLERFDAPLICSNFCKAVSLKRGKDLFFFTSLWNSIYDNGILFGWESKTSGIKNLLFESFVTNYHSVVPEEKLIDKFFEFAKPLHSKIQKNLKENQELTSLRDWLLPMLMNGQVKVGEALKEYVQDGEVGMAAEGKQKYAKS